MTADNYRPGAPIAPNPSGYGASAPSPAAQPITTGWYGAGYSSTVPAPFVPDVASLWARIAALAIDIALYSAVYLLVTAATGGYSSGDGEVSFGATGIVAFLLFIGGPAYFIGMEAARGATIGKRLLRLRVVRTDGGDLSVGRAALRYLGFSVDCFFVGLVGLIVAKCSDRRQRVGDRWADSIVVRAD